MGTAATMGIEENLALANRRGKSRGLRQGITSQERELFRGAVGRPGPGPHHGEALPRGSGGGREDAQALYALPGVKFMLPAASAPVNVKDYLSQPNVIACGGSWLCPAGDINEGNWEAITQRAQECMALVQEVRAGQ